MWACAIAVKALKYGSKTRFRFKWNKAKTTAAVLLLKVPRTMHKGLCNFNRILLTYCTESFSSASAINMLPTCGEKKANTVKKLIKTKRRKKQSIQNKCTLNMLTIWSYHTSEGGEEPTLVLLLLVFVLPKKGNERQRQEVMRKWRQWQIN